MDKYYLGLSENGSWEVFQSAPKYATKKATGYLDVQGPYNDKQTADSLAATTPEGNYPQSDSVATQDGEAFTSSITCHAKVIGDAIVMTNILTESPEQPLEGIHYLAQKKDGNWVHFKSEHLPDPEKEGYNFVAGPYKTEGYALLALGEAKERLAQSQPKGVEIPKLTRSEKVQAKKQAKAQTQTTGHLNSESVAEMTESEFLQWFSKQEQEATSLQIEADELVIKAKALRSDIRMAVQMRSIVAKTKESNTK